VSEGPSKYDLDLSREEVDYVLETLSMRPWREANGLIGKIASQTQVQNETWKQQQTSDKEPAPDGVADGDPPYDG